MYGYEDYIDITPEQLLQKITQEKIFEFILKLPFSYSARYLSPFRDDSLPDCRFERRPDGTIIFVDFGEKLINPRKIHRGAFGMVMDRYGISLNGAVRLLCGHFGLSTSSCDYTIIAKGCDRMCLTELVPTVIDYQKKEYNKSDRLFWSQFLIKPEHLTEDGVFSSGRFTVSSEKGFKIVNVYKHCYVMDFLSKKKIYQPYSEKYKWITNCDENVIGNIDNLPPTGDELIIQKSYKDHRVLRNLELGLDVIWFMNEGCVPDLFILKNLTERFKLITIFYDNDHDGVLAAMKLYDIFEALKPGCARMIHLPIFINRKLTYKDPGEFINKEGKIDLIQVLKQIGIYGKNT